MFTTVRLTAATSMDSAPITDPPSPQPTSAGITTAIHALSNHTTAATAPLTGTTHATH